MAKKEVVQPLRELLAECLEFNLENLISRTDWGSINFEAAKEDLERIFAINSHLNILPLEYLTDQAVQQILQALTKAKDVITRLDNFNLSEGTPTQVRDELVNQIHSQADNFYTIATPWIPFLAYQKGDVAGNIEALTKSVTEASGLVDSAKTNISEKQGEIDGIITRAREASASAGATVFTQDFNGEATTLNDGAKNWLIATGGFAIATIGFAVLLWFITEPTTDPWQAAQKFGARLAVLAVLFTATFWCGKNYKALKHQATNNRHRALSLQTFQAFSAAASDDATRDAVLLETTRSIFSNTSTGYIESPPAQDPQTRIIEVARMVSNESE